MHNAKDLSFDHCFWFHKGALVTQHDLHIGGANLRQGLMQIGLGLGQVNIFGCCNDADRDVASTGFEEEGVKKFVIMHEEMYVEPKRISQYNFSEFGDTVDAARSYRTACGFPNDNVSSYQFCQHLEIVLVCAFLALLFKDEFLFEHETHKLILAISDDDHVNLLGYYLILHYNIMNNSEEEEELASLDGSVQDIVFSAPSHSHVQTKNKTYSLHFQGSFQVIIGHALLKKTLNTSWSERYFLLTPTRLLYFQDTSMRLLKGCFNLASLIQHRLKLENDFPVLRYHYSLPSLIVRVDHSEESRKTLLQLKIEEKGLFKQWLYELSKVISQLQTLRIEDIQLFPKIKNHHLLENNSKLGISDGNFWNNLQISTHELFKYASHLDIIFLRSKNPIFYLHRFFMRSYYDHVAVLFKDETEKVFLFEAVQSKGVCISSLQSLLTNIRDEYEEVGYRKLMIKNNTNIGVEELQDYINSILGSKYELSLSKLFIDNESIENERGIETDAEDHLEEKQQKKTYFCSELVADIYLRFGILAEGKSNNYWPRDFQSDQMILSHQFSLSPLMKVQLDDPPEASELSDL